MTPWRWYEKSSISPCKLFLGRRFTNFIRFLKGSGCKKAPDHCSGLSPWCYRKLWLKKVSKCSQGNRVRLGVGGWGVGETHRIRTSSPDFQLLLFLLCLHSLLFCHKEIFFVTLFAPTGFDLGCSRCFALLHFKRLPFACFPSP